MPRVTDEHRAERRQQIIDAARVCFIRDGFHQTSMTDIFAEAGLSAGAVYGYFKGKYDLITAIAERVVDQLLEVISPLAGQEPPLRSEQFVYEALTRIDTVAFGPEGYGRLAPQVWSESLRNPDLAGVLVDRYGRLTSMVAEMVERQKRYGLLPEDAVSRDVVRVMQGSFIGYIIQRLLFGSLDPRDYAAGVAAIAGRPWS